MPWYYYSFIHNRREAEDKARQIAKENKCRFMVVRVRGQSGDYIHKLYFNKQNIKR